MAGFGNATELLILDAVFRAQSLGITGPILISLHVGDPGETGANEVTGGSYARQECAFSAAASGAIAISGAESFTGMPACTVTHFSFWDSSGTPKFLGSGTTTNRTLESGDTYVLSTATFSLD